MSSRLVQLGLLSLASVAAAHPYKPEGYGNSTVVAAAGAGAAASTGGSYVGYGHGHGHSRFHSKKPQTQTSVVYLTVTPSPAPSASEATAEAAAVTSSLASSEAVAQAAAVSSSVGAAAVAGSSSQCVASYVTVTATDRVTVTVTPGQAAASTAASSAAAEVSTAIAGVQTSSVAYVNNGYGQSSAAAAPVASSSAAAAVPVSSSAPVSSAAPVVSSAVESTVAPSSSAATFAAYSSAAAVSSAPVSSAAASSVIASTSVASSTSAAASSTSTSTSSTSGTKRGVPYNDASLTTCFENTDVTWAYNWGYDSDGLSSAFEYVPTLWGTSSDFTDGWNASATALVAAGTTYFFSFNEPDESSQANLTPAEAAEGFMTYMQPLKDANSAVQLGAPSVTNGEGSMGLTWLSNFLTACADCSVDFVNIHWYSSPDQTDYFKSHVQQAYNQTGLPVWVTEFGCTSGSDEEISAFLEEVLPWMDEQEYVARYAYFMAEEGSLVSSGGLSSYGSTYATAS